MELGVYLSAELSFHVNVVRSGYLYENDNEKKDRRSGG
jgi:hypothetical protein